MMRRLLLRIEGDALVYNRNASLSARELPHIDLVQSLAKVLPHAASLVAALACGAFDPYDLRLLSRLIDDHKGFGSKVEFETFQDPRTMKVLVQIALTFDCPSAEAARSMLNASSLMSEGTNQTSGKEVGRARLRRAISGG